MKKKYFIVVVIVLIVVIMLITAIWVIGWRKKEINTNNNVSMNNDNIQTEIQNNVQQNTNKKSLPKIELKEYVTVTYGKYGDRDKNIMEKGTKMEAYPLDIKTVLEYEYSEEYSKEYRGKLVSFSGYVNYYKDGFFVITETSSETAKYQNTIIIEDKNIISEYGWNIADGEYVTVAGLCKGFYQPKGERYFVLNDVFIVK